MPDKVNGHIVGDDFVHEGRVVDGPAGFCLAELLREVTLGRRGLPRLPDVGGKFGVNVVGELVLELLAQRLLVQLFQGNLLLHLLWHVGCVKGLVRFGLGRLVFFGFLRFRFRLHRGGFGHVVGIAVDGRLGGRVGALEQEEQSEAGERKHERFLEGEHRGRGWPEPGGSMSGRGERGVCWA